MGSKVTIKPVDRRIKNQKIFQDTRKLSLETFKDDTMQAVKSTIVYQNPDELKVVSRRFKQEIIFSTNGTMGEAYRNRNLGERMAILNFADALEPGGLVLQGETTQEEDICRCTNLYECLIKPECKTQYYDYNKNSGTGGLYTDAVIYSKDVRILKHDTTYNRVNDTAYIDVITCPAPCCKASLSELTKRIRGILKVARYNEVDTIILGAWGCGAFGQDARVIGACFAHELKQVRYFRNVIFAIKCVNPEMDRGNFDKFRDNFYNEYEKE